MAARAQQPVPGESGRVGQTAAVTAPALLPLPPQPEGVPWPTTEWPEGPAPDGLDALLDRVCGADEDPATGHSHAVLVVHQGRLVAERYAARRLGELEIIAGADEVVGPDTPLLSWSMAKSVLHTAVGLAVGDGVVDLETPAPIAAWAGPDDPRSEITWDDLLTMRPGLSWVEEYDGFDANDLPDVVRMLYGEGAVDMAGFAAACPLVDRPGSAEAYRYSSGTSNLVARALAGVLGLDTDGWRALLQDRLLGPLGIDVAEMGFDGTGLWVASSYLHLTARDFARFGLFVLRDGTWQGERVLPEGWVDHGRRLRSPDEDTFHGAHWWGRNRQDGLFYASGYDGQRIVMVPERDVIVVRLGRTPADQIDTFDAALTDLVDLFGAR